MIFLILYGQNREYPSFEQERHHHGEYTLKLTQYVTSMEAMSPSRMAV